MAAAMDTAIRRPLDRCREVTQASPLLARSRYGGPPTASIRGIPYQPEKPNSMQARPCGNNASTELSLVLMTCVGMPSSKGKGQLAPHVIVVTRTANARTEHPDTVQTGRPRPVASTTAVVKLVTLGK
jgi:hypothetical protein